MIGDADSPDDFPRTLADRIKSRGGRRRGLKQASPPSTETISPGPPVKKRKLVISRVFRPSSLGGHHIELAMCDAIEVTQKDAAASLPSPVYAPGSKTPGGNATRSQPTRSDQEDSDTLPGAADSPSDVDVGRLREVGSLAPEPTTHEDHMTGVASQNTVQWQVRSQPPLFGFQQADVNHRWGTTGSDEEYVAAMQTVLARWSAAKSTDIHKRQAKRIKALLNLATPPGPSEAYIVDGEEAARLVAPNHFVNCPIFTADQQPAPLHTVDQFLAEFYDDNMLVDVQNPGLRYSPHTVRVAIGQVKERFKRSKRDSKPWNLLEMATHVDDGIKPAFLNGQDCRLLTKLKIPSGDKTPTAARRAYDSGYREVERWALLAQAGALTEPHQDSHGYSTFITVNDGHIGFGWLSNPSPVQRTAWLRQPFSFTDAAWRYKILGPGQTVYFPAGTVHFVFRLPQAGNSLAFGGHVLRCTNIVHWARTLLEEKSAPAVTNEELTECAAAHLLRVEAFVNQAGRDGTEHRWGGKESIAEFLKLKEKFFA